MNRYYDICIIIQDWPLHTMNDFSPTTGRARAVIAMYSLRQFFDEYGNFSLSGKTVCAGDSVFRAENKI
jgi:hypothetical protein